MISTSSSSSVDMITRKRSVKGLCPTDNNGWTVSVNVLVYMVGALLSRAEN
jgi:hypothetical protein